MKYLIGLFFCTIITIQAFNQDSAPVTILKKDTSVIKDSSVVISINPGMNEDLEIYKLKPAIDIPLTGAFTGLSLLGFSKIYSKERSTEAEILSLKKSDINSFDRSAADNYSEKATKQSDMLFYGSMPLPLVLLLDKDIRKDAAKIGFLYLEALSITGVFYTGSNYFANRYRPLAYNPEVPMDERRSGSSTNSFIGGHPALVATSVFFIAKVYSDYHPESNFKWVLYTAASASTFATAYLRYKGGKHFPSDLITGVAIGTLSGILVPQFHKNKLINNERVKLAPFHNGMSSGLSFSYRL
ncbi:MAG: phosphatase PAP2 family protein [Chitinophagaceae bacterium]|jgi:hypothetical protein|nr:phosphatase PAP2 family protein [Chitinophagaceae bacterium]